MQEQAPWQPTPLEVKIIRRMSSGCSPAQAAREAGVPESVAKRLLRISMGGKR